MLDPWVPQPAEIVERRREAERIYTYRLRLQTPEARRGYRFLPGQFNMLYVFGAGEIPISIVSDPDDSEWLDHTIRIVGNITGLMEGLRNGDIIGLRGPFGSSWPLAEARGKDVVIVTGGLGCAPVVSVIHYIMRRRRDYGSVKILHGIKTPKDLLFRKRFREWSRQPNTEVYLTVDHPDKQWKYHIGVVTNLFSAVPIETRNTIAMICGPEVMMRYAARDLLSHGLGADRIYLSMERNMKCAVGFCGHCQFGPAFVCKDGPIYRYDRIEPWLRHREI